jgi:hypothetical protein
MNSLHTRHSQRPSSASSGSSGARSASSELRYLEEKVRTGAWKKDFDARVVVPAMDGVAQPLLQA